MVGIPMLLVGKVGNQCPRDLFFFQAEDGIRYLEGPLGETPGSPTVSMKLQSIATQAKRYPEMVFDNVFHLIDLRCGKVDTEALSHLILKPGRPGIMLSYALKEVRHGEHAVMGS